MGDGGKREAGVFQGHALKQRSEQRCAWKAQVGGAARLQRAKWEQQLLDEGPKMVSLPHLGA